MTTVKDRTVVETKYGKVEGFVENGIYKWFGIPFAKPPVGELRFKRSVSPEPWSGVLECKKMGNRPHQFDPEKMLKFMGDIPHPASEDCLTLNIWAPENAEKAPVFVWIYGGANHMGDTVTPSYQLDSFPRHGIIGVSFNYRLGPFGFYDFSRLDSSFDSNCAVSDMILAVRWVKENIEAFGGDPDNITICGESAGGTAVYALLTAPSARGTFSKAIAMSGLPGNVTTYRTHELNNQLFLDKLGIRPNEVAKLKTMSYEEMREAGAYIMDKSNVEYPGIYVTGPVIDDLLPQHPWEALALGNAAGVRCIIGTCRDEGTLFYNVMNGVPRTWEKVEEMLRNSGCPEKLPLLKKVYGDKNKKKALQQLGGDRLFWADSVKCALAQSRHSTVYSYRFDYASPLLKLIGLGAMHGSDISYALNTCSMFGKKSPEKRSKKEKRLVRAMHGSFVNFIKTGDPNGEHLSPSWEPYDEDRRTTYIFNTPCSVEYDPHRKRFEVWKDIELYK